MHDQYQTWKGGARAQHHVLLPHLPRIFSLSARNANWVSEPRLPGGFARPLILLEHVREGSSGGKIRRGPRSLPTPKSSVALNSSVPANRLTSVAAVLKASSIPLKARDQKLRSTCGTLRFNHNQSVCVLGRERVGGGGVSVGGDCNSHRGSLACHRFWTQWRCRRSHRSASASGFHSHR